MDDSTMHAWHVTVTVAGDEVDASLVHAGLTRLAGERPFLSSLRYDGRSAELAYWEQALGMLDAASLALRVWDEHRETAGLPRWRVVGLEVLEIETYKRRSLASGAGLAEAHSETPRRY